MLDISSPGPDFSLNKFQPVYVASGTCCSGIRTPAISLPSRSTALTNIGNSLPMAGGSLLTMPRG